MKCLILLAALLGVSSGGLVKRAAQNQNPGVWSALDQLRGKAKLGIEDIRALLSIAKAGQDYPNLNEIPAGNFDCGSVKAGFYADVEFKCQVIRRCDVNGNQTAYLCPNLTVFNQITLVCHWYWDVDCSKAKEFYDYSNSRLYQGQDVPLLDNEDSYVVAEALGAISPDQTGSAAAAAKPAKRKNKKS
ncbi:uncharacterized protein LOC129593759 [Paramacrobiotus metropolitanus]|uniref:uncharacterized protein LOC129593759 n=1 Tax=Paramacrobiotus metropolitanus TaxID=2943436 RepID=UPI0024460D95|nr:uncharacterized protein LOC129593759 [Paramacrobiotus metropolitanus]